jgi:hypothetical protein
MAADFDNFNYKNHKLDCIFTFISNLEISEYAIQSLKAIVLYDFFENQQNNDKYTKYLDSEIIEMQIPQIEYAPLSHCTTGIHYPEQLSRYINRLLFQLERINIPNFEAQLSIHNHLSDDYFETYSETVPLCDVLKMHGYEEHAELFTHEFLGKNTFIYFAFDIFSLRDRLDIPEKNDYPLQFFPNVPSFNEVFFNYTDKATYSYTRYNYTKYISDWLYCRVTLPNWQRNKKIKIFDFLTSWQLDSNILDDIYKHALSLYKTHVSRYSWFNYSNKFDKIQDPDIKKKLAVKENEIISDLAIGDIMGIDKNYVSSNLFVTDINLVSKQLQNSNHIPSYSWSDINIYNPKSTVIADALILYKKHLAQFINPTPIVHIDLACYEFINFDSYQYINPLPTDISCSYKTIPFYDIYKSQFDSVNFIMIDDLAKVYSLWMAVFLNDKNVLVKNNSTGNEERLNGANYRDSYIQGFNEGAKCFQDTYSFAPAEFYANAESIVADLKHQYDNGTCDFGFGCNDSFGWKVIKDPNCFIKIAHKSINKFGYYSGIVYSLTVMSEKYPKHFNAFFNTDIPLVPDYRFQIKTEDYFKNSSHYNLQIYDWAVHEIERNGYAQSNHIPGKIKFFTAHMAALLLANDPIPVLNVDQNREPASINSKPYLDTFIIGYNEGIEFFNNNYSLAQNEEIKLLYAGKPESYVNALKSKYFAKDIEDEATDNHWNFVTMKDLYLISHKEIKKYGFYSGIVGEVKSLIAKHSDLFKDFYDSDNSSSSNASPDDQIRIISSSLNISFSKFQEFKDIIKFLDTNNDSAIKLYASLTLQFDHLKREILDNKLILSVDKFNIYLIRIKLDFENIIKYFQFVPQFLDILDHYVYPLPSMSSMLKTIDNIFDVINDLCSSFFIEGLYMDKNHERFNQLIFDGFRIHVIHDVCEDVIEFIDENMINLNPISFTTSPAPPTVGDVPTIVSKVNIIDDVEDDSLSTKFESRKTALYKYGFDKITFIDFLSVPKRDELIAHLCNQNLNYQIAMLNYLDFINYIVTTYEISKNKRNIILSEILGFNNDNIRKCIYSLDKVSPDNRFFAINFAQDVKSYCLNLRNRA